MVYVFPEVVKLFQFIPLVLKVVPILGIFKVELVVTTVPAV